MPKAWHCTMFHKPRWMSLTLGYRFTWGDVTPEVQTGRRPSEVTEEGSDAPPPPTLLCHPIHLTDHYPHLFQIQYWLIQSLNLSLHVIKRGCSCPSQLQLVKAILHGTWPFYIHTETKAQADENLRKKEWKKFTQRERESAREREKGIGREERECTSHPHISIRFYFGNGSLVLWSPFFLCSFNPLRWSNHSFSCSSSAQ